MTYADKFSQPNGGSPHPSSLQLTMTLDGELSGSERTAVTAHLEGCAECREHMDGLQVTSLEISAAHRRLDVLISGHAKSQHSASFGVTSSGELRPETTGGTAPFGNPIRLARSYISGYNKGNKLMSTPSLQPVPNPGGNAAGSAAVPPSNVLPTLLGEGYGIYGVKRGSFVASYALTTLMVVAVVLSGRFVVQNKEVIQNKISGIVTDISPYILQPSKTKAGGGGGGGDHDKIEASKGALPKFANEQFTPPVRVIRNPNPVLPVTPTVVVPPQIKISSTMPAFGDPFSHNVNGPDSNGTGTGGGIGSGSGGGVGSGSGPGVGPGYGGGIGGGVYSVGGGVSAPKATYAPDPEYSEEARKAKFQGVVVLWCVVGADGRVRDVRVQRSLGMGLDQKAIEAVRTWRFEPARKDGTPVPVQIAVKVNFRLY